MKAKQVIVTTVLFALTLGLTSTLVTIPVAIAGDDPRSDRACDEMLDLEGFQDTRTESDSTIPDSDIGSQKAFEGAHKALGDCPLQ